jgi:hypothetical protein
MAALVINEHVTEGEELVESISLLMIIQLVIVYIQPVYSI